LGSASDFISSQTDKTVDDHQETQLLHDRLNEQHREAEYYKALVIELKKRRPIYIPVKEDIIDVAIGDYINNRDDPLVVPFLREDREVYSFGTKRVFVKYENGKIIVRVGGGFM
jgi:hypothetical protein